MDDHFNKLTPAEAERLAMLAEECGEVIQIIGKILLHGYNSYHPDNVNVSNRDLLRNEIIDVSGIIERMFDVGDINDFDYYDMKQSYEKKLRYSHHQNKTKIVDHEQ